MISCLCVIFRPASQMMCILALKNPHSSTRWKAARATRKRPTRAVFATSLAYLPYVSRWRHALRPPVNFSTIPAATTLIQKDTNRSDSNPSDKAFLRTLTLSSQLAHPVPDAHPVPAAHPVPVSCLSHPIHSRSAAMADNAPVQEGLKICCIGAGYVGGPVRTPFDPINLAISPRLPLDRGNRGTATRACELTAASMVSR
jgi:hypothetical protein